jgi:hypothetical protein
MCCSSALGLRSKARQLTSQQVLDLLHVDFHVANFDGIFDITIRLDNSSKNLLDDSWNKTFERLVRDIRSLLVSYYPSFGGISANHHS